MKPVLITIPISHYCEKARWALEYSKVDYDEDRHLQIFHMFHTYRAAKSDSVPVLTTDAGPIDDSTDILKWADSKNSPSEKLYPEDIKTEVEALEDEFDEGFGVAGRLWMYTYMLHRSNLPILLEMAKNHRVPWYEQALLPIVFPLLKKNICKILGATTESRESSKTEIDRCLNKVAERLKDGRTYLFGNRFTAADLTFASLSAPILQPENYGVELPPFASLPTEMRDQILIWRAHPAGKFAQSLFLTMRRGLS